jgi:chromosomal replication initiation ATPase DnaA
MGLTVDMQAPDYETRLAILHSKAEKVDGKVPKK